MRLCKIESCPNKHLSGGYCVKHYLKFKKYGDPLFEKSAPRGSSLYEVLAFHGWDEIEFAPGLGNCWVSRLAKNSGGYVPVGRNHAPGHRVSYEHHNGAIPVGALLRHGCDNPGCVNPGHLSLGTTADNSRDMVERGRSLRGERHHAVKLTEDDVWQIRSLPLARSDDLATAFNVSRDSVNKIRSGRVWAWLR